MSCALIIIIIIISIGRSVPHHHYYFYDTLLLLPHSFGEPWRGYYYETEIFIIMALFLFFMIMRINSKYHWEKGEEQQQRRTARERRMKTVFSPL